MKLIADHHTPNIGSQKIPVEFVVLHYTACDLRATLNIFLNPESKVSSHFVIDTNGDCYDLGGFYNGPIRRGAHAGVSSIEVDGVKYSGLNGISVGIEIVNLNGNFFTYTEEQYQTLEELLTILQQRFPVLNDASRIIGHEHIAYWRGKADPGVHFDWSRVLTSVGLEEQPLHSFHACRDEDILFIKNEVRRAKAQPQHRKFWPDLSGKLELRIKAREEAED